MISLLVTPHDSDLSCNRHAMCGRLLMSIHTYIHTYIPNVGVGTRGEYNPLPPALSSVPQLQARAFPNSVIFAGKRLQTSLKEELNRFTPTRAPLGGGADSAPLSNIRDNLRTA